jgi:spermidine synthase
MIPWKLLDTAPVPGDGGELTLFIRDEEYSIRVGNIELMNSRVYGREDALSELGCARIAGRKKARVLIGGLGMGFALATALRHVGADAQVVVAELVPGVIKWNRETFGHLAAHPLRDRRVVLREMDVARVIRESAGGFDAVLLDIDNGPDGLTRRSNGWLYSDAGIASCRAALREAGVLGIWSAGPDRDFVRRLHRNQLQVDEVEVGSRSLHRGARHTLWFATPPTRKPAQPRRSS